MAPLASRVTPMVSELVSTQTVNSFPSMHQSPRSGSFCVTLAIVSVSMLLRVASCTSSSHSNDTEVAHHFIAATATLNQPHMGKWPTSFSHTEKVLQWVMTGWTSGMSLLLLQRSLSLSLYCCWRAILAPLLHPGEAPALCMSTRNAQNVFWPPRKT